MLSRRFRQVTSHKPITQLSSLYMKKQHQDKKDSLPMSLFIDRQTFKRIHMRFPTYQGGRTMASASYPLSLFFFLIFCTHGTATHPGLILTVVNNCPFTIWPAIQPNAGHPTLEHGGFELHTVNHRSFPVPDAHWSGRIWARTGCVHANGCFSCATGDCGGRLECDRLGGAPPATLAQFSLHHGQDDFSSYGVSLVDGFNLPMTVTPHEGKGQCPVVGCREDLLKTCPHGLQVRGPPPRGHAVVGCKSGCAAFGTDELCCRNHFNSPQTCRPSGYSDFFKHACPATFTYAHDSPSLMHECSALRELKVIFCH